jgi:hypothetical protein
MIPFNKTEKFLMGRAGEREILGVINSFGWWTMITADYSGENGDKAPRLYGPKDQKIVVPDICAFQVEAKKNGKAAWFEVKTKTHPCDRPATKGEREHGIPYRHYEEYLRVEKETGVPVILVIYELNSDIAGKDGIKSMLCASLAKLKSYGVRFHPRGYGYQHDMGFIKRCNLIPLTDALATWALPQPTSSMNQMIQPTGTGTAQAAHYRNDAK